MTLEKAPEATLEAAAEPAPSDLDTTVSFVSYRDGFLDHFMEIHGGWTAPGLKKIKNPTVPASTFDEVNKWRSYEGKTPINSFLLSMILPGAVALLIADTGAPGRSFFLITLVGFLFAFSRATVVARGVIKYDRAFDKAPEQKIPLLSAEKEIYELFTKKVEACRRLDPSVEITVQLAEIEERFIGLTVAASDIVRHSKEASVVGLQVRHQMIRLLAEVSALFAVMNDAKSVRVLFESARAGSLEEVRAYPGLASVAEGVEEERAMMASYLKELA